jgi:hypothetical protein
MDFLLSDFGRRVETLWHRARRSPSESQSTWTTSSVWSRQFLEAPSSNMSSLQTPYRSGPAVYRPVEVEPMRRNLRLIRRHSAPAAPDPDSPHNREATATFTNTPSYGGETGSGRGHSSLHSSSNRSQRASQKRAAQDEDQASVGAGRKNCSVGSHKRRKAAPTEKERLPCIYHIGEPARYHDHTQRYAHISGLL